MAAERVRGLLSRRPWLSAGIVLAALALIGASAALAASRMGPSSAAADSGTSGHSGASGHPSDPSFALVSSNPSSGASQVAPDTSISLLFSSALGAIRQSPTLTPPVPGTWVKTSSDTLTFQAASSLPPGEDEQLSIPGGPDGLEAEDGQHLAQSSTLSFSVAPMPVERVQQLLAELGYLPLSFAPSVVGPPAASEMAMPQVGAFTWRWTTLPANFVSLWSEGQPNVITSGAVMVFESQHGLGTDGVAGPRVWSALLAAGAANQSDTFGHYDFVEVSTSLPEHVDVWRDGAVVYSSAANTGIEAAPTERGTWPVFARYTSTTMSGTNPDGSHYSDPGVPWVSYFHGGDALHGFIRSSYGSPQSLGCVEMPPANAEVVYPFTPLGTLVTVA